jgi:hypothetical protein
VIIIGAAAPLNTPVIGPPVPLAPVAPGKIQAAQAAAPPA